MNEPTETYLGIEIGGTKLQIVVGDDNGKILHRWRASADRSRGGPGICEQILAGLVELRAGSSPRAIGVGFGGPIDWKTGRIARSHQIEGWQGFELGRLLREQTGLPVATENDANAAALAEAVCGAGVGQSPMFYFNLGSGVGGGIVIDSQIYHGLPPGEAEFGHLRLDRSGATVESRCSGWAIDQRVRAVAAEPPDGFLAHAIRTNPGGGEARFLSAAVEQQDTAATAVLNALATDLAFALSHVVHLLHPAAIVMGGGLSLIGEPLRKSIADALPKYLMEVFFPGPPIRLAAVGEDAVPVGALLLARNC